MTTHRSPELDEPFAGEALDRTIWSPFYLPHWSSRAETAATYEVRDGALRLTIPPDQPLWCADLHPEPLRVSCIQSGSWSGPLGSTLGQQSFSPGLVVRQEQPPFAGYTPRYGTIEIRMRGLVDPRSMVACWLVGVEDTPNRSGEICIAEVFGDSVRGGSAAVGMGVHAFRDPRLREAFTADRFDLDVAAFHTYAVDWRPGTLEFAIDGRPVHRIDQAPDYPMQLMIGIFDFPTRALAEPDELAPSERRAERAIPELIVSRVRGWAAGPSGPDRTAHPNVG